ncbi:MAG: cytochrome c family protein [Hyphomonadaceae bacterium]|nr:cytochrome c family protein [Hyphomonadaceae bacterium]
MSNNNMWFTAIAGAVLATGLGIMGLRSLSDVVFARDTAAVGYPVEVAEVTTTTAEAAGPELLPDWGTVMADAATLTTLVADGDELHKVCSSCHSVESGGANKTGPTLYSIMGRTAGTHPGFGYSEAMKAYGKPWDFDGMYNFLKAPKRYIEGTSMGYAGMSDQEDRIALVAYLRSLSSNPIPLPAPDPTRDPAAVAAAAAAAAPAPAGDGAAAPAEGAAPAAPANAIAPAAPK